MKNSATSQNADERRASYHHGDLAAALKAVAVDLIAQRGVEGFSLREAAVALKVSPSAAYRHFANKAELLAAVSEDALAELAECFRGALAAVAATKNPGRLAVARFQALGRAYVRFALEHPARFQAIFGLNSTCEARQAHPGSSAIEHPHAAPYLILCSVLDELRAAQIIGNRGRPAAEVTAWSAIHGLASLLVAGMLPTPSTKEVETLTDQVTLRVVAALQAELPTRSTTR